MSFSVSGAVESAFVWPLVRAWRVRAVLWSCRAAMMSAGVRCAGIEDATWRWCFELMIAGVYVREGKV